MDYAIVTIDTDTTNGIQLCDLECEFRIGLWNYDFDHGWDALGVTLHQVYLGNKAFDRLDLVAMLGETEVDRIEMYAAEELAARGPDGEQAA